MSIDISKFLKEDKEIDYNKLESAVRLTTDFLDSVIDASQYPTPEIAQWAKENRATGNCTMGWADLFLMKEIAYGSKQSLDLINEVLSFIYQIAKNESEKIGAEKGVPFQCQKLSEPRRNITILSLAPTGTCSLIAGCSSGIEPIFSEITVRNDKTGTYIFENDLASKPYFRCAVASDENTQEVTWEEHVNILSEAQKHIDSGVSKTINFPNHTRRETIAKAIIMAWKSKCKGIAVYRNGSRKVEVLSPKNLKKDKCPACGNDLVNLGNCKKCLSCNWNFCE
jgi:ribonucleoside-diphosphate reductase alpha chain